MSHLGTCTTHENCWCEVKRYSAVFVIAILILIVEVIGGIFSGSLALLADAGHVFVDTFAVSVSIGVACIVRNTANEGRIRAIGGVANAILLGTVAFWVFYEALDRLENPNDVISEVMIFVAILGTIGNYYQHKILDKSDECHVTQEAMSLHVLSDLFQSLTVVVGGIVIFFTDWYLVDPLLSFCISLLMMYWAIRLMWKIYTGKYDGAHHH